MTILSILRILTVPLALLLFILVGIMANNFEVATSILTRAVTYDKSHRYTEALVCYQEGIQILLENMRAINDEARLLTVKTKVTDYMDRAEKIKAYIEQKKTEGKYEEHIKIEEDTIRHSYATIFSRFLDSSVRNIEVDDSYIRSSHQCDNFLRFVELCLKLCPNLKTIKLKTGSDSNHFAEQSRRLTTIQNSSRTFDTRNIDLQIEYSDSIHDREIRLDNGWVIKIGRGLDYFKPVERLTIGFSDFDLRPCKETTIDIFHRKELSRCY